MEYFTTLLSSISFNITVAKTIQNNYPTSDEKVFLVDKNGAAMEQVHMRVHPFVTYMKNVQATITDKNYREYLQKHKDYKLFSLPEVVHFDNPHLDKYFWADSQNNLYIYDKLSNTFKLIGPNIGDFVSMLSLESNSTKICAERMINSAYKNAIYLKDNKSIYIPREDVLFKSKILRNVLQRMIHLGYLRDGGSIDDTEILTTKDGTKVYYRFALGVRGWIEPVDEK